MREGRAGGWADEQALSLSLANACNPYCKRIPLAQDNTSRVFPLVFHLALTHLGWDTQRQFYSSVQGPPRVKTPTIIKYLEPRTGICSRLGTLIASSMKSISRH
jgi:hypothetical protein